MVDVEEIKLLVERFERNLNAYRSGKYKEEPLRLEFINPFFQTLGWDVDNEQGYAEAYKEVIHEDSIRIGGATKAPDYCFRIGGTRKFFVEAKKPSVDIKENIHPAYQLRRYAWSAKLPLSILTDFEEFAVYDCRIKPAKTDKASAARILYIEYSDYLKRWDEIASIFSKDAVLKGSFDRYVESTKLKRGTAEVDDAFLAEIEQWRDELARNIALRNPKLSTRQLNFAVQKTIDRIIFLRICEDRGIEGYGQLQALLNGTNIYQRLTQLFRDADDRYNSGLFHFKKEKSREEPPDDLTLNLTIDNDKLKRIIKDIYYPDSPYEFSVLPADILGHVYEQFLGKVIRLTKAHYAKVEEKPEVRKAGGVYYTPTYIVDYIVSNTVGKLCEGKTPAQVAKLRILDPACGSGSFLLGAYQYLLDWHRDYYIEDGPEKHLKQLYQVTEREWRLSTEERKRILTNNIYGVDIDLQAVEVTKLSLLLKVLEGESEETLKRQLAIFHQRALPDLGANIKCGNSLIGSDFYANRQTGMFDDEEQYRINAFDWETEFPEVFSSSPSPLTPLPKGEEDSFPSPPGRGTKGEGAGGFDVVIGNPPYVPFQEVPSSEKDYYARLYESAVGKYDQYVLFMERALSLLKGSGFFGFIIPNKFILSDYGKGIKKILLKHKIIEILDFRDIQVFSGATNYPCILLIEGEQAYKNTFSYKTVSNIQSNQILSEPVSINQNSLTTSRWVMIDMDEERLLGKLKIKSRNLGSITETITQGLRTGALQVFFNNLNSEVVQKNKIENNLVLLIYHGKNVKRYTSLLDFKDDLLLFPYQEDHSTPVDIDKYPKAKGYLAQYTQELRERKDSGKIFKNTDKKWFEYWDSKPICFRQPKIVFPDISAHNNFFLDEDGIGYLNTCYGIFLCEGWNYKYVLGLLNSRLLEFFVKRISPFVRGGFYRYKTKYMEQLPIRTIDFDDPEDKERHDKMVKLVERMLELNKKLAEAKVPDTKKRLQRRIDHTDREIDKLVYELYNLIDEEIKIVEGG